MWINEPTPVTISVITEDKGSHSSEAFAPTMGIHENRKIVSGSSVPLMNGTVSTAAITKGTSTSADASQPDAGSPMRLPNRISVAAPRRGRAISSQR
jgi:hypothetical protein